MSVYCVYVTHEQINNSEGDMRAICITRQYSSNNLEWPVCHHAHCMVTRNSTGNNSYARCIVINVWIWMVVWIVIYIL